MVPASSVPRIACRGFEKPRNKRDSSLNPAGTSKLRTRQSPEFTVVARTRIRTSRSFGTGFSTSINCTTSGGPYRAYAATFICRAEGISRAVCGPAASIAWTPSGGAGRGGAAPPRGGPRDVECRQFRLTVPVTISAFVPSMMAKSSSLSRLRIRCFIKTRSSASRMTAQSDSVMSSGAWQLLHRAAGCELAGAPGQLAKQSSGDLGRLCSSTGCAPGAQRHLVPAARGSLHFAGA
jgi:hypothetical protein